MPGNGNKIIKQDMIRKWIDGFLRDCRVRDLSSYTVEYYRAQLAAFETFCSVNDCTQIQEITPDLIRAWLLELKATHNAGGMHAKYRAVRRFLNWWQEEADLPTNPITKVKPPKITQELIEGISIEDIRALLATCSDGFTGKRDRAILLCLLDCGARAREFLSLDLDDVDTIAGSVLIRQGKGRKPRVVFIGRTARRALRAYLKLRTDEGAAVWVTSTGERLAVRTLQGMLVRRAKMAGVTPPSPHDFRRAHALIMLRAGTDVITLARLMGHASLEVLSRYLKQTTEDLRIAHEKASPADSL